MLNMAQIIGHLGRDPDVRYTPEGTAIANLAVATNETWKDKDGEKQERTEWHRVVLFGKVAEIAGEYLKKGSLVYLQGRLQTRKWQGDDGQDRYTTEIVAERMKMLGGKGERDTRAANGTPAAPVRSHQGPPARPVSEPPMPADDDIPFRVPDVAAAAAHPTPGEHPLPTGMACLPGPSIPWETPSMSFTFKKATKSSAKLRAALFGPSGAGKTFTALRIAAGLGGAIAVIDTERGSASKYADRFGFDVLDLEHAAIPSYQGAIEAAARAGYPVLVIDSLSHGWQELLQEVDRLAAAKYRGNTWSAWSEGTPKQRALVDAILSYPGHVIATMRSKTEWSVEANGKGKQAPVRVGLAPEQGKGIEYEFDLLLELSPDHIGHVIKDRTGKFQDALLDKPGEDFGRALAAWLCGSAAQRAGGGRRYRGRCQAIRQGSVKDEAPESLPEPIPGEESGREAPIDEEVQAQVERLVARAAKVGAWGQAEEYCRSRFNGPQLAYALAELRHAKDEAQRKKTERQAA